MKKKPAITKPATSSVLTLHAFAIAARTRPGQSAYASLLGLIPGDESDEEFIHALEELPAQQPPMSTIEVLPPESRESIALTI